MNLNSAQYLIRFDDLCPTMLSERLDRYVSLVARHGVRPILSVVPDNQDPALDLEAYDPRFWDRLKSLQAAGATIAMHGYRHLCASQGKSLLGLNAQTEFAGVEESQQRLWIHAGLSILRNHGLRPRLFVAPRHGFDLGTLRALGREGLGVLSGGFARRPFTRYGVVWIPQQLWEPVPKSSGLWTISVHTNSAVASLERKMERFLDQHGGQFTCFDRALGDWQPRALHWTERIGESMTNLQVRVFGPSRGQILAP